MKPAHFLKTRPALTKKIVLLLLFFVALKLFIVSCFLKDSGSLFAIPVPNQAVAQEAPVEETPAARVTVQDPPELKTLRLLGERKKELERREALLREEEEHLNQIKAEIEKNLEGLTFREQNIDERIKEMISLRKSLEDEELKKLAQVFESTPPEQAGPMFDKLDVKLAAKILFRMKGRSAGKIWGYVNPDQAVLISRELSGLK